MYVLHFQSVERFKDISQQYRIFKLVQSHNAAFTNCSRQFLALFIYGTEERTGMSQTKPILRVIMTTAQKHVILYAYITLTVDDAR